MISRFIAALAYAGAAFLFGMALGERGELGVVQHVFTAVIPIAALVIAIFSKRNRAHILVTGAVMLLGVLLGQRQFAHAWDECLTRGHEVRDALQKLDGDYPPRLVNPPCRAGFRPTILHYLSNERGFRLWMTNNREVVNFSSRVSGYGVRRPRPPLSNAEARPPRAAAVPRRSKAAALPPHSIDR